MDKQANRSSERDGVFVTPQAQIVRAKIWGQFVYFTVANPEDEIQAHHVKGEFYEPEELGILRESFPLGGAFLDIGANVGNHSVFVAKFLHASKVVLIEPNPPAIALLESNVMLNQIDDVCDLSKLGYGLSDGEHSSAFIRIGRNNLGGARVKEGSGDVPLATADSLIGDQSFDLIKIDVEGMEIKVLQGLKSVLERSNCKVFIEVDQRNYEDFEAWRIENKYRIIETFQRYHNNTNFLIEPMK